MAETRGDRPRWGQGGQDECLSPRWGEESWGVEPQGGWRGPGELPGYREGRSHGGGAFQQPTAGGQIPAELREWDRAVPPVVGPHGGRGPRGYHRSDERLHEDLCDRLTAHPAIDAREVKVEVSDGRVVLRGSVPDRRSKYHAEDLAEDLPGVVEVDNRLRVAPAGMRPPEANGTQMS